MIDIANTNPMERLCPGPEPENEMPVLEKPDFVAACMSKASDRAALTGWRLGNSTLTHSDIWGFVFRIDFQSANHLKGSEISHRLVCWSADEGNTVAGTALVPGYKLQPL
jgi:hypothetical protein